MRDRKAGTGGLRADGEGTGARDLRVAGEGLSELRACGLRSKGSATGSLRAEGCGTVTRSPPRKVTTSPREARGVRATGRASRLKPGRPWCEEGRGSLGNRSASSSGGSARVGRRACLLWGRVPRADPLSGSLTARSLGRSLEWRTGRLGGRRALLAGRLAAEPSGIDRGPFGGHGRIPTGAPAHQRDALGV